jgi:hypothetical protein
MFKDNLMVGLWCGKGLKQWTIRINGSNTPKVFTGYGFVGPTGKLTGGQLPATACGAWGMNQAVKKLDTAQYEAWGVYGSADCVYFYTARNSAGIVTHLNPTTTGWSPVTVRLMMRQSSVAKSGTSTGGTVKVLAGSLGVCLFVGAGGVVSTSAYAYAYSAMSTWLTRNAGSDVLTFRRSASDMARGIFQEQYPIIGVAMAAASALSGAITANAKSPAPATVADAAMGALDMVIGVDSLHNTKAGPWSFVTSFADIYSIGNDSAVFAGPGFVQHQFVQSHWIGGGSGAEIRASMKGIAITTDITTMAAGVGPATVYAPAIPCGADVFPVDMGPQGESKEMRIPAGRLGFRHLYLNYPSEAAQSSISQTTLYMTTEQEQVKASVPNVIGSGTVSGRIYKLVPQVESSDVVIPAGYSVIDGCANVLEKADYLGVKRVETPEFSDPFVYDYLVNDALGLWYTAIDGEIVAVSVDDTKVLDGEPSNVVFQNQKILLGSSYTAIEVLSTGDFDVDLLRPRPVTSSVLAWNTTGYNILYNDEIKHGFDAYSNRILSLKGSPGLDVERLNAVHSYVANGPLKTSSIFPPAAVFGLFSSPPQFKYTGDGWSHSVSINLVDQITQKSLYKTLDSDAENKNGYRYSVPIIHDRLALLPAAIKTIAAYKTHVIDGISSLTTELRSTNGILRRPRALDFTVYGQIYRWNEEYISKINQAFGTADIRDIVATLGLDYIGSTPEVAWFYSPAIRAFYNFEGSETIRKLFTAYRLYDVDSSTWDFVNQEVVMRAKTKDDRPILVRTDRDFTGEIAPIAETVGQYDFYSMAGGMTFQGLNKHQVNRFLLLDYMIPSIVKNMGKWKRVRGETIDDFWSEREYDMKNPPEGYFFEPWKMATAFYGLGDTQECMFEWRLNFALTEQIARIWGDKYVTVFIAAETITTGGIPRSPVTKVRLRADMFNRKGDYGYYPFKFVSNNGAGDSERLFVWSDGIIALRSLEVLCKTVTEDRTSPLLTAPDFAEMKEL